MTKAYVLLQTEIGSESEVLDKIKQMTEVKEVHAVYGVYDLIAKVETDDSTILKDDVIPRIRHLDKVRSTTTMIEH